MSIAEKHIQHFNRLNGKPVSKVALKVFYDRVKKLNNPLLKELEQRLASGLSKINGHVLIAEIDTIDLDVFRKAEKEFNKPKVIKKPKVSRLKKKLVAAPPKPKGKTKSAPKPPMKRKGRDKVAKEKPPVEKKPVAALAGFTTADQTPQSPANTFVLPGEMGRYLSKLQRYKLMIVIAGETHSSKSQMGMQLADAFMSMGDDVAWIDWEQGGLQSKDTQDSIARNVTPENKRRLHVHGEFSESLEAVKELASHYKVIALDSGTKLKQVTNAWMDSLRKEFPDTVWIIMMQQNEKGGTRGGSAAEFDAPVVIKTYRPDHSTHEKNYAELFKNRGNPTGLYYLISAKKVIPSSTQ